MRLLKLFASPIRKNGVVANDFQIDLRIIFSSSKLGLLDPRESAELLFGEYIRQDLPSPLFWGSGIVGSYKKYPFGHNLAKVSILEAANDLSISFMPLFVLNYIFDIEENIVRP